MTVKNLMQAIVDESRLLQKTELHSPAMDARVQRVQRFEQLLAEGIQPTLAKYAAGEISASELIRALLNIGYSLTVGV